MTKNIKFSFRWPVKPIGPQEIVVEIPMGNGPAVLNQQFVESQELSAKEIDEAEYRVLESIAIIK
jgi:hypothetical protein